LGESKHLERRMEKMSRLKKTLIVGLILTGIALVTLGAGVAILKWEI
jgi:predicted Zn-dependent protease